VGQLPAGRTSAAVIVSPGKLGEAIARQRAIGADESLTCLRRILRTIRSGLVHETILTDPFAAHFALREHLKKMSRVKNMANFPESCSFALKNEKQIIISGPR
jgi:hypothetical protein